MVDEDGYLYVVDRLKDVIIRGGENIYSVEIEHRLSEHPSVLDVAVIGVAHDVLGEEVMAVVQVAPGEQLGLAEAQRWVAETLADFKVPAHIRTTHEPLARNASGKLLKGLIAGSSESAFDELL
jgi:acyl-CoA synthetase (AMP-forming)/AMP-acid ligase II